MYSNSHYLAARFILGETALALAKGVSASSSCMAVETVSASDVSTPSDNSPSNSGGKK